MYAANVNYELRTFQMNLEQMNRIQCNRVRIFHDGLIYGHPKYFALQISHVESSIKVNVDPRHLLVRIEEYDSK